MPDCEFKFSAMCYCHKTNVLVQVVVHFPTIPNRCVALVCKECLHFLTKIRSSDLKQFIVYRDSRVQSDDLIRDFVTLFQTSRLAVDFGNTSRLEWLVGGGVSTHDRKLMEKVFTLKDAVPLILDLERPKNRCSMCPTCTLCCVLYVQGVFNGAVERIGNRCVRYWCNISI